MTLTDRQKFLRLDASKLKDEETRLLFCRSVKEKFESLEGEPYEKLNNSIDYVAKEILPNKPKHNPSGFKWRRETFQLS